MYLMPPSDYVHIVEAEGRFRNMPHYHDVLGFRWHPRFDSNWEYRERGIAVPLWFPFACFALLPRHARYSNLLPLRNVRKGVSAFPAVTTITCPRPTAARSAGRCRKRFNFQTEPLPELYHANSSTSGDDNTAYDPLNRVTGYL